MESLRNGRGRRSAGPLLSGEGVGLPLCQSRSGPAGGLGGRAGRRGEPPPARDAARNLPSTPQTTAPPSREAPGADGDSIPSYRIGPFFVRLMTITSHGAWETT